MELGKLGCALGKHKWVKAYVKDNKYNAWECEYCGAKKYYMDLTDGAKKEKKK